MSLQFKNVSFAYPKTGRNVLNGVSFSLNVGELVFLLGANGNGKSTLLSLANGQLTPQQGEILLDDIPMQALSTRSRAEKVATCFQLQSDIPDFTVRELVLIGRTPYYSRFGRPSEADINAAERVMNQMKLDQLKDRPVHRLSGGERQRALIALTLVRETPYMLLDEPTAAADPGNRIFLMNLFREYAGRHGLLVVTHDLELARKFATRVILLYADGSVLADDTPQKAFTKENLTALYGQEIAPALP